MTTFGADSPLGLFERRNAQILMFGCGWEYCTQLHMYEEEAKVPYRYFRDFTGQADFGGGMNTVSSQMYVRDLEVDATNDFSSAIRLLRDEGHILTADLGGARLESVACNELSNTCRKMLGEDPYAFVERALEIRYRTECRRDQKSKTALRIALLGSSNLEFLKTALFERMTALLVDREVSVYTPPFGQAYQEILLPESGLHQFQPDITFFCDRLEDIFHVNELSSAKAEDEELLSVYLEMISRWADGYAGTAFVNRFASLQPPVWGTADIANQGVASRVQSANDRLGHTTAALSHVHLYDLGRAARQFEEGAAFDPRLWFLGRFPFSKGFSDYLAERYAGLILATLGRTARLLVVDLDNTLWGGVLGEDGREGLQLGGDYPGNAFLHFQHVLRQLMDRGLALAIASKNDEKNALHAIEALSGMVIRESHLASYRINWLEKWRNVLEMAEEIGLGLENIVFVDDSPVERAQMQQYLPAVKVLELPEDPALYAQTLLSSPYLECINLTDEDRKRSHSYVAKRHMEQSRKQFADPAYFFASLQLKLHIATLGSVNLSRATQLVNKTNQFNTTTRRYALNELLSIQQQDDSDVFVIGLKDRFSEFENIGVAIIYWNQPELGTAVIDLFLLSCRVLGRGVESGFLAWLGAHAKNRSMRALIGHIIPSRRNTPVRDVYQKHGFQEDSKQGSWLLGLSSEIPPVPAWLTIVDEITIHGEMKEFGNASGI
jgi:FkbH-like protein